MPVFGVQVQVLSSVPQIGRAALINITFGTSGYRGIIGQTFTNHHLIAICHAIEEYFKSVNISKPRILLGYDTRTGNSVNLDEGSYTFTIAAQLSSKKIHVDFCDTFTATPVISWAVKHYNYDLGINLTASHNPPNYNGVKINDSDGAPAPLKLTNFIQEKATNFINSNRPLKPLKLSNKYIEHVNYTSNFIDHTQHILKDVFKLGLADFSNNYIIDTKCGSGIDIWKALTNSCLGNIVWLNDQFSSDFNFKLPDPTSVDTLNELSKLCIEHNSIAFSNDPDADRHIIFDENGEKISPEKLTAIIIHYCIKENILIESVSTTLSNSILVKKICEKYNIPLNETNIGFKFFTPFLKESSKNNKLSIGVESSGGFSISFHTFDKCGFMPILIILGIMKKEHLQLSELSKNIDKIIAPYSFIEDSVKLVNSYNDISQILSSNKNQITKSIDIPISKINTDDGLKIIFQNDDWVLCRASGTEPLIRIYAESRDKDRAIHYIKIIKRIFE